MEQLLVAKKKFNYLYELVRHYEHQLESKVLAEFQNLRARIENDERTSLKNITQAIESVGFMHCAFDICILNLR